MKYILNPSKPSLGFVFLVCLLSIVVIIATGSYFLIKFFLLLALIYLIDNSVIALIENKGIYQIHKGYLFKQKKTIEIDKVKEIKLYMFSNKGGYGYKMYFVTEKNKIHFTRETSIEQADEEIKKLRSYFALKYSRIKFNVYNTKNERI